jgi:hypothetical protein
MIDSDLGGYDTFKKDFANACVTQFGLGLGMARRRRRQAQDREDAECRAAVHQGPRRRF